VAGPAAAAPQHIDLYAALVCSMLNSRPNIEKTKKILALGDYQAMVRVRTGLGPHEQGGKKGRSLRVTAADQYKMEERRVLL